MFKRPSKPLSPLAHFVLACVLVLILFFAAMLAHRQQVTHHPATTTIRLNKHQTALVLYCWGEGWDARIENDGTGNLDLSCKAAY